MADWSERETFDNGKIKLFKIRYRAGYSKGAINPFWQCRINLGRGKPKKTFSTNKKDKIEALSFARDEAFKLSGLDTLGLVTTRANKFADIARMYFVKFKKECQDKNKLEEFRRAEGIRDNVLLPEFGDKNMSHITSQHLATFYNRRSKERASHVYLQRKGTEIIRRERLTKRTIAKSTVAKEMGLLRAIFRYASDNGFINKLPDFPKGERTGFTPRPHLTKPELDKLQNFLNDWPEQILANKATAKLKQQKFYREALRDWVLLIANSGLRTGEASLLKWKDWEILEHDGKPYCSLTVRAEEKWGRKTGARPVIGLAIINECLAARKKRVKNNQPEDYIFQHNARHVGKPIMSFKGSFEKALEKCGLLYDSKKQRRKGLSPYILRHTYATEGLAYRKAGLYPIALNLGNQSTTTEKFYSKATANDFIGELLGPQES